MGELLDYAADLRQVARLASDPDALEQTLRDALHALEAIISYDLAVLYDLRGNELVARQAAGRLADDRITRHRLRLADFPTIRRAFATRRPIPLAEHDHTGDEGDPYDGVVDLPPGHACMVIPLCAGGHDLGLITLDRTQCETYSDGVVALADVYGQLVSSALLFAEQTRVLERHRRQLEQRNRLLREDGGGDDVACKRIEGAKSPIMQRLAGLARQVAATDVPVLIRGETGVGKEVLAQAIHAWSGRAQGPFIKLNCAAIPHDLVESELFGHVKGAFSGAVKDRTGRFLAANGGTLLLDEVGDMPPLLQAKLLRVLQEGTFEPVGSDSTIRVDVRVIAASHVDLGRAIEAGAFREDLYYRLAAFPLEVPALRERPEDIVPLAESWLADAHARRGRGPWTLPRATRSWLSSRAWPGNVRELHNALERATVLAGPRDALRPEHFAAQATATMAAPSGPDAPAIPTYRDAERAFLERAVEHTGGKIYGPDGAAALLDLKPTTLQSKLAKHGIRRTT